MATEDTHFPFDEEQHSSRQLLHM